MSINKTTSPSLRLPRDSVGLGILCVTESGIRYSAWYFTSSASAPVCLSSRTHNTGSC
ncbi:unnamed protein product [Prunus brigantina]